MKLPSLKRKDIGLILLDIFNEVRSPESEVRSEKCSLGEPPNRAQQFQIQNQLSAFQSLALIPQPLLPKLGEGEPESKALRQSFRIWN